MLYPDAEARRRTVLVVVVNNPDDLRRAAAEGWYRIPQRRAPRRIGADYLAFYKPGVLKERAEAQPFTFFAPPRLSRLPPRRDLLPAEAGHPRADEFYFRIDIGPLQRLARPIPAEKYHRVTFIHTTLDRLLTATDVTELFRKDDPVETLWQALREHRLRPLKNRLVGEQPVDIALRARGGYLGIRCLEDSATQEAAAHLLPDRWELLHFSARQIEEDLNGCLRQVGAVLIQLGGSVLNAPQPEG